MSLSESQIQNILEAALLTAGQPLNMDKLVSLFGETPPEKDAIRQALSQLGEQCAQRGIELKEVASGFRYQAKQDTAEWVSRLWEEKPPRYSRAVLETLVLIAYRQPITRGEIEHVRGVSVSSHIIKTLLERDWVKVVGHRDVPGRPAIYATTKAFLDYFNLKSLDELPPLSEIRDLDKIKEQLDLQEGVLPDGEDDKFAADSDDEDTATKPANEAANETAAEQVVSEEGEVPTDVQPQAVAEHAAGDDDMHIEHNIDGQASTDDISDADQNEADEALGLANLEEAMLTEEIVNADGHEYEHVASGDDLDSVEEQEADEEAQAFHNDQDDDQKRPLSAVE